MPKAGASKIKPLRCPTCGTLVTVADPEFPFCSDRCRVIDLGKWASGAYRISSPVHDPELLDELDGLRSEAKQRDRDRGENG